ENKRKPGMCGCGTPDTDSDSDGNYDCADNCAKIPNPDQKDTDSDRVGDACDDDCDNDGIPNEEDTCPYSVGDNRDCDGVESAKDNCPDTYNPQQQDKDSDGLGDACDWNVEVMLRSPDCDVRATIHSWTWHPNEKDGYFDFGNETIHKTQDKEKYVCEQGIYFQAQGVADSCAVIKPEQWYDQNHLKKIKVWTSRKVDPTMDGSQGSHFIRAYVQSNCEYRPTFDLFTKQTKPGIYCTPQALGCQK
ncbi:MAG TPA: thrombospondin type 3 repeat-containing protein, partial [Patescibacteria group bacterium]|nr:thrombospondin type 3 repeat-containing protein [Patescibacteria group bacterium]